MIEVAKLTISKPTMVVMGANFNIESRLKVLKTVVGEIGKLK